MAYFKPARAGTVLLLVAAASCRPVEPAREFIPIGGTFPRTWDSPVLVLYHCTMEEHSDDGEDWFQTADTAPCCPCGSADPECRCPHEVRKRFAASIRLPSEMNTWFEADIDLWELGPGSSSGDPRGRPAPIDRLTAGPRLLLHPGKAALPAVGRPLELTVYSNGDSWSKPRDVDWNPGRRSYYYKDSINLAGTYFFDVRVKPSMTEAEFTLSLPFILSEDGRITLGQP